MTVFLNHINVQLKEGKKSSYIQYIYVCMRDIFEITFVGTRAQIWVLGLKPYLIMWIHLRRSKRLDEPQNGGSHTEKDGRVHFEEVILLRWGECRSSKYLGNLGDLPGISSDKDELQARIERIRMQKYLREKLLPSHSMHQIGRAHV